MDYKGFKIEIIQDQDSSSPREDDNFGTMICFHKRYNLGDKHGYRHEDYSGWDALRAAIETQEDAAVILPLYLYDHSGITISTTPFSCRWDSGQIGFIFISKAKLREEFLVKCISQKHYADAAKNLIGEVGTYDQYLRGDIYGFKITDPEGEEIDSCWGFFGEESCLDEAKQNVDYHVKNLTANALP